MIVTNKRFTKIADEMLRSCRKILENKKGIYGSDKDRLINFRMVGYLTGQSLREVVLSLVAKHIAGLYYNKGRDSTGDLIKDIINYMLILWAINVEEGVDTRDVD